MAEARRQEHHAVRAVGSIDLDDAVFGAEIHEHLLWEVVKWQLAKRRAGTASTKRLGEVRGSSKKVLEAEGHRPGAPGQPAGRRTGSAAASVFGPKPAQLRLQDAAQGEEAALRRALSLRASEQQDRRRSTASRSTAQGLDKSVATALAALGVAQPTTRC